MKAESRKNVAEEQVKKNTLSGLIPAITTSEKEETARKKSVEHANMRAVFDEQAQTLRAIVLSQIVCMLIDCSLL